MESRRIARYCPGMSEENVEVMRQIAAAWNRRDLEAYLELVDPEVEWRAFTARIEGAVYRGHEGVRRWWKDLEDGGFEELVVTLHEIRELDHASLGLGRLQGRSKEGVPVDTEYGVVIRSRNGLAVWGADWFSHSEALKASGLRE